MSMGGYIEMTDPTVIRALSHPARVAIISYLGDGPATATECSSAVDLSPSACSYHLRTLAELGFVEPDERSEDDDGRKRRWRLKARGHGIPKEAQDSPEVLAAAELWGRQWVAVEQRMLGDYLERQTDNPIEWRKASSFVSDEIHLTPDELIEIVQGFQALLAPYAERTINESQRPASSRLVHLALTGFPTVKTDDRGTDG